MQNLEKKNYLLKNRGDRINPLFKNTFGLPFNVFN